MRHSVESLCLHHQCHGHLVAQGQPESRQKNLDNLKPYLTLALSRLVLPAQAQAAQGAMGGALRAAQFPALFP